MMNHCINLQQNASFMSREESNTRGFVCDSVVYPKPRRVRLHSSQSGVAVDDSRAGADLFDIIRRKEESLSFLATSSSSPPFFLGSPPSRATNPLAQDARFGDSEKLLINSNSMISPSLSLSSPSRGCGSRMKFGIKPAKVRVEGFDCQNSSIPAMA